MNRILILSINVFYIVSIKYYNVLAATTIPNCRTPAPENNFGWCVPTSECKIISDIKGISLTEFPEKYQMFITNSKCSDEPEEAYCCILEHINHKFAAINGLSNVNPAVNRIKGEQITQQALISTNFKIPRNANVNRTDISNIDNHPNLELLPDTCGTTKELYRVRHGKRARVREFPFMALLQYNRENPRFDCGGTLINKKYILTAAHCASNSDLFSVRLGEHNINTEKDCVEDEDDDCNDPVQDISIESSTLHDRFDAITKANDIALLRLTRPANITTNNVHPICLPTTSKLRNLVFTTAQLSGWGFTEHGNQSSVLVRASLNVNTERKECEDFYFKKFNLKLTDRYICAVGRNEEDSCSGDSGGPLFKTESFKFGEPRKYLQFGIVSAGPRTECDSAVEAASLYVNVPRYMKWILDNIRP